MTTQQAQLRTARLGLSAWTKLAVAAGHEHNVGDQDSLRFCPPEWRMELKRVGFAGIDLPIAEGETWEEAFGRASKIIFAP